jgi:transcriptional regulator with PAS, ATPase and Fis domain
MVVMNIVDMTKIEELRFKYNELKDINKKIKNELNILNKLELKDNLIISKSQQMKKILMLALRAAKVDSNILIEGESGVGKGVLSSYIHNNSERKEGPFVKVDCSTLSETLIESELFGYESGSFTGARKEGKAGLIQMADKGTLFLDEIGELPLKLQVKILGVIQDKVFQKVGGNKNIKTDIRIIAATNRNLFNMVEEGTFREDLYYRLKVIKVKIPSLRERKDDIIPLIDYFIKKYNKKYNFNKNISVKAKKTLLNYKWPGNIRELENEIERLVVLSENDLILESDIFTGDIAESNCMSLSNDTTFKENVYEYEKKLLKTYMKQSKDIHELSLHTGLEESTIRKKAKRLNIEISYR